MEQILAHMNKDHRLALEDYLVAYGEVKPSSLISEIKLNELKKDSMKIEFKHPDVAWKIEKVIPIDPPMEDVVKDSRKTLVEMAKSAAAKRGYSHKQVRSMLYPTKPIEFLIVFLVLFLIVCTWKPQLVFDQFFGDKLGITDYSAVKFVRKISPSVFYATLVCHLVEFYFVMWPKLKFYRVPNDYKVEWIFWTLLDGNFTIRRFKTLE